jgi:hypothetical protein
MNLCLPAMQRTAVSRAGHRMRLLERHYNFLELANWIVPLGWIFLAHRFYFPS